MRLLKYLLLLLPLLGLGSCDWNPYSGEVGHSYTPWIATMNLDGSNVQYIHQGYGNSFFCHDPLYNRERILTVNADSLYIMDVDGGNLEVLATFAEDNWDVSFSRFNYNQNKLVLALHGDIYLYDIALRAFSQLTATPWREKQPTLSPDGTQITYISYENSDSTRCLVNKQISDLGTEYIMLRFDDSHHSMWTPVFLDDYNVIYTITISPDLPRGTYKLNILTGEIIMVMSNHPDWRIDVQNEKACAVMDAHLYFWDGIGFEEKGTEVNHTSLSCPILSQDGRYISFQNCLYDTQTGVAKYNKLEYVEPSVSSININNQSIVSNIILID